MNVMFSLSVDILIAIYGGSDKLHIKNLERTVNEVVQQLSQSIESRSTWIKITRWKINQIMSF